MSVNKINFNSDLAERDLSFYQSVDLPLIAQINSANIGCLYHGGAEEVVQKATQECHHQGVSIGAHISFLDLPIFLLFLGRKAQPSQLFEIFSIKPCLAQKWFYIL